MDILIRCETGSDFDAQNEVFMLIELKEEALAKVSGKVIYPKEYLEA